MLLKLTQFAAKEQTSHSRNLVVLNAVHMLPKETHPMNFEEWSNFQTIKYAKESNNNKVQIDRVNIIKLCHDIFTNIHPSIMHTNDPTKYLHSKFDDNRG